LSQSLNHAKVFLVEVYGKARPGSEIKHIDYWKPGSKFNISRRTAWVIKNYFEIKGNFKA